MVQFHFVLSLSDHVCLVVARPGVKDIIGKHRFNSLVGKGKAETVSCRPSALPLRVGEAGSQQATSAASPSPVRQPYDKTKDEHVRFVLLLSVMFVLSLPELV